MFIPLRLLLTYIRRPPPFIPLRLLLTYIRRPPPPAQVANSHSKVFLFRRPLPLSLHFAAFSSHPHRLHHAHGTGESKASGTPSCCWDLAQDRRAIRFLGSVFTRLLALVQLLRLRTSERLLPLRQRYALWSSGCIDCVRLHRLRSLTMSDIGKSGDAVTQRSTGYSLKPMSMFISCIIMNIVMFNCCLNIHTCT
jgi:hypothetical protein